MMDFREVEKENKVYVNDKVIILDEDHISPAELLELAGFSSLEYDIYLKQNTDKKMKNNKIKKPLRENSELKVHTGMSFDAMLKQV